MLYIIIFLFILLVCFVVLLMFWKSQYLGKNKIEDVTTKFRKKFQKRIIKEASLSYETLKFEYSDICEIIDAEIENVILDLHLKEKWNYNFVISEFYLIDMHKLFSKICEAESVSAENRLLELLACFHKSLVIYENCIFREIDRNGNIYDTSFKTCKANRLLLKNVIKSIEQKLSCETDTRYQYYKHRYIKTKNSMYADMY